MLTGEFLMKLNISLVTAIILPFAANALIRVPIDISTIQGALNASTAGDTIWVAPGVYSERLIMPGRDFLLVSDYFFTGDTIAIDSTIIDASLYADLDTASIMMFRGPNSRATIVSGFTLTGGHGVNYNPEIYQPGGGCFNIENANPTLSWNYLKHNQANAYCALFANHSSFMMSHCRIDSNCGYSSVIGVLNNINLPEPAVIEWTELTGHYQCFGGPSYLLGACITAYQAEVDVRNCHFHDYGGINNVGVEFIESRGEFTGNLCERLYTEPGASAVVAITNNYDNPFTDNVFRDLQLGRFASAISMAHGNANNHFESYVQRNWFENILTEFASAAAVFASNPNAVIEDNVILNCVSPSGAFQFSQTQPRGCDIVIQRNQFFGNTLNEESNQGSAIATVGAGPLCDIHDNLFEGNAGIAIQSYPLNQRVWDLTNNYWGDASGPYHPIENPSGLGDTVDIYTTVTPWLTEPPDLDARVKDRFHLSPEDWTVEQAFPNPFNASTNLRIISSKSQPMEVAAYNTLGQRVARVWQGVIAKDSPTLIRWDAVDDQHRKVASGIYYLVAMPKGLGAGSPKSAKVVLLR